MVMSITPDFIRTEIEKPSYEISLHADDERIAEGLTVSQLEFALSNCKIIEQYPDDPRGKSCLVLGFTPEGTPVHIVCGKNPSQHLILITVYVPTMPKWMDPYTRNQ
jgi:hypothetical protein